MQRFEEWRRFRAPISILDDAEARLGSRMHELKIKWDKQRQGRPQPDPVQTRAAMQRFEDWRRQQAAAATVVSHAVHVANPRRSTRPRPGPAPRPDEYVGRNAVRAIGRAVAGNRRRR